jgi:hypothetical protein
MPHRNGSAVYLDLRCDVTQTRKWLAQHNRASGDACSLQTLFLFAAGRIFVEFPAFNRFVSGSCLYQRSSASVSFVVKEREGESTMVLAKVALPVTGETLKDFSLRITHETGTARATQRRFDRQVTRLLKLPTFAVRGLMRLRSLLDDWNLLPASLVRDDPFYTSLFVSNLGSIGGPAGYHHLYEYGTCGVFAVLGAIEIEAVTSQTGEPTRRRMLPIRLTVDERVADGMTLIRLMRRFQGLMENPQHELMAGALNASAPTLPSE